MNPDEVTDSPLDPLIHEAARLLVVSVLNECEVANFNFLLSTTGLTRGNLSAHVRKLVNAGYVEEKKEIIDRKPHTEYRLTMLGRQAFDRYRVAWQDITNGPAKQSSRPGRR